MASPKKSAGEAAAAAAAAAAGQDVTQQLEELKNLIKDYASRFDRLETMLKKTGEENKELKKKHKELEKTLLERDEELLNLKVRLNDQEQYVRGWSVRILGMQIPENEATQPLLVMRQVYARLLLPIFRGAQQAGILRTIPEVDEVLETAHILPAKPNTTPAIICRFFSRNIRAMVFRLKKDYAPRLEPETARQGVQHRLGRYQYLFFEDLTRPNFLKLRALSQHEKVASCWSINGSLKYKLKDSENVVRVVKSVFATVDDIVDAK